MTATNMLANCPGDCRALDWQDSLASILPQQDIGKARPHRFIWVQESFVCKPDLSLIRQHHLSLDRMVHERCPDVINAAARRKKYTFALHLFVARVSVTHSAATI